MERFSCRWHAFYVSGVRMLTWYEDTFLLFVEQLPASLLLCAGSPRQLRCTTVRRTSCRVPSTSGSLLSDALFLWWVLSDKLWATCAILTLFVCHSRPLVVTVDCMWTTSSLSCLNWSSASAQRPSCSLRILRYLLWVICFLRTLEGGSVCLLLFFHNGVC